MGKTVKHAKTVPKGAKKAVPAPPLGATTKTVKKSYTFEKNNRSFRIGGDILPKRDVTRFTKWPKYIRHQRQKRILLQRLKVPPSLAQFDNALDKHQFVQLVRVCMAIAPETVKQKTNRLREQAAAIEKGQKIESKCPPTLKYGLNHVTQLVEDKKAKLVVIAHDVDPMEMICWLPTLCRKMNVPFCIVKSKSRLGQLVHKKTAACVAITSVPGNVQKELDILVESAKANFNENRDLSRRWGGGIMGNKSNHVIRRARALLQQEQAKKMGML